MPIYNAALAAVDAKETRRYAGLQRAEDFSENLIAAACEEALVLIEPRSIWQEYGYDAVRQMIFADGEEIHIAGKSIGKHLAGCEKVIALAATVGETIENEVTAKFDRGEYTAATLLDAAATAAVEQVADETEKAVRRVAEPQGFLMRRRFSPGYGDWQLAEQRNMVRLCRAAEIGIALSSSLMLMPRKSVTAIIGLKRKCGEYSAFVPQATGCKACGKVDCPSRLLW